MRPILLEIYQSCREMSEDGRRNCTTTTLRLLPLDVAVMVYFLTINSPNHPQDSGFDDNNRSKYYLLSYNKVSLSHRSSITQYYTAEDRPEMV